MDQTHTRAIEALQSFIHLAQSNSASSPRFVANLITNATSSPQTYVFAELLESPAVQALRAPETPDEFKGYLTLLEIFAWGTWEQYHATPGLPELNDEQTLKLRLLSLLSLSTTIKPLTYSALMNALSIPTKVELESLVTAAVYASLIKARLSPASNPPSVNVTAVAPLRDVLPQSLPKMIANLTEWESRCSDVVTDLEAEIARVKSDAANRAAKNQALREAQELAIEKIRNRGSEPIRKPKRGAGRLGTGAGGSKRDADNIEEDDGFFDPADGEYGSRMDIDEDHGARGSSRQPKRVLGRKS
ncbi:hypothetical protein MYU51_004715 [Penicillium brevicompactum]|uniref:PCI domain-containing protein n=1 Tax=Penicillium brevicompactum TaxID=5074 RepID=A0A9W9R453_PENBR|nr:hypothetical protein N7452_002185 [Penicillium brevicompactum]